MIFQVKEDNDVSVKKFPMHFRYRKVTPKMRLKMKMMLAKGKTKADIARFFGLDYATIAYHLDSSAHAKTLARARKSLKKNGKKPKTERKKTWDKEYYKERYHEDPEFRMKVIRANQNGGRFKEAVDEIEEK